MTRIKTVHWARPGRKPKRSSGPRRKSSRLQERKQRSEAQSAKPPLKSAARSKSAKSTRPTNLQSACPFFHTKRGLPREIRDIIFKLALTSYEDKLRPRDVEATKRAHAEFCCKRYAEYCPGYFWRRRIDTALLRTCRLIHLETSHLPVAINTHTLWYGTRHLICHGVSVVATNYFSSMTPEQLAAVQHLHIFAPRTTLFARDPGEFVTNGCFAELGIMRRERKSKKFHRSIQTSPRRLGGPFPQSITITLRQMNNNITLVDLGRMLTNKHWRGVFGGLNTLRMELEVRKAEREKLEPVVASLLGFTFDIGDGEVLVAEETVQERSWTGLTSCGSGTDMIWKNTEFIVATVVWRMKSVALEGLLKT